MADMKMESFDGNLGNDMGMSTVGYRSAKYNPMEWRDGNYARLESELLSDDVNGVFVYLELGLVINYDWMIVVIKSFITTKVT